jgi:hypothetical protein
VKTPEERIDEWWEGVGDDASLSSNDLNQLADVVRAAQDEARAGALEDAARCLENGSFLHGESGEARLARAAAAAIRALKGKP